MKLNFRNKFIFFILIILVFSSLYFIRISSIYINIIQEVYYPFGKVMIFINTKIDNIKFYFSSLEALNKENIKLKKDIKEYELILQDYEEVINENNRIRKLFKLKLNNKKDLKLANIIGRSPDIWHKEIIANIGKNDNININNTVISYNGLIGLVKNVTSKTAKIQTISDPSLWISVQNNRSRSTCMLKSSDNNKAKLYYISEKSDFKVNDIISTSGLGGVYPKGIPIGIVSKINKISGDIIPEIYIDLLDDFSNIEEVIILK